MGVRARVPCVRTCACSRLCACLRARVLCAYSTCVHVALRVCAPARLHTCVYFFAFFCVLTVQHFFSLFSCPFPLGSTCCSYPYPYNTVFPPGSLMLALCVFPIVFLLAPILLPEVSLACSQGGGGGVASGYGAGGLTMTSCTVSHNTAEVRSPSPPRDHVPHAVCLSSLFTPPPLPLCLRAPRESLSLSLSNTHPHVIPGAVWCVQCGPRLCGIGVCGCCAA